MLRDKEKARMFEGFGRFVSIIFSVLILCPFWISFTETCAFAQSAGQEQFQVYNRGFSGKRVSFEVSGGQLPVKEFEYVEFSHGGYKKQLQARNFSINGNSLVVELYDAAPHGGKPVEINYRTTGNSYQKIRVADQTRYAEQVQPAIQNFQPETRNHGQQAEVSRRQSQQAQVFPQKTQSQNGQKSAQPIAKGKSTNPILAIFDILGAIVVLVILIFLAFSVIKLALLFAFVLGGLLLIAYGGDLANSGHPAGFLMIIIGIPAILILAGIAKSGGATFISGWFRSK